jgi:uncharacterized protein YjiS (DUF1127 family)
MKNDDSYCCRVRKIKNMLESLTDKDLNDLRLERHEIETVVRQALNN